MTSRQAQFVNQPPVYQQSNAMTYTSKNILDNTNYGVSFGQSSPAKQVEYNTPKPIQYGSPEYIALFGNPTNPASPPKIEGGFTSVVQRLENISPKDKSKINAKSSTNPYIIEEEISGRQRIKSEYNNAPEYKVTLSSPAYSQYQETITGNNYGQYRTVSAPRERQQERVQYYEPQTIIERDDRITSVSAGGPTRVLEKFLETEKRDYEVEEKLRRAEELVLQYQERVKQLEEDSVNNFTEKIIEKIVEVPKYVEKEKLIVKNNPEHEAKIRKLEDQNEQWKVKYAELQSRLESKLREEVLKIDDLMRSKVKEYQTKLRESQLKVQQLSAELEDWKKRGPEVQIVERDKIIEIKDSSNTTKLMAVIKDLEAQNTAIRTKYEREMSQLIEKNRNNNNNDQLRQFIQANAKLNMMVGDLTTKLERNNTVTNSTNSQLTTDRERESHGGINQQLRMQDELIRKLKNDLAAANANASRASSRQPSQQIPNALQSKLVEKDGQINQLIEENNRLTVKLNNVDQPRSTFGNNTSIRGTQQPMDNKEKTALLEKVRYLENQLLERGDQPPQYVQNARVEQIEYIQNGQNIQQQPMQYPQNRRFEEENGYDEQIQYKIKINNQEDKGRKFDGDRYVAVESQQPPSSRTVPPVDLGAVVIGKSMPFKSRGTLELDGGFIPSNQNPSTQNLVGSDVLEYGELVTEMNGTENHQNQYQENEEDYYYQN